MKQLPYILFLIIAFNNHSFAQNEKRFFRHEISVNVNTIFKQFISKSNKPDIDISTPFKYQPTQLSYRYFFNSKIALRIGGAFDNQMKVIHFFLH